MVSRVVQVMHEACEKHYPEKEDERRSALNDLYCKRTNLHWHKQGIDTTTPGGKLLFQMLGMFKEFERSMIVERVKVVGLKRARRKARSWVAIA
jgi:DNA invertase Pin-like site-specific DNA recombinase